MRIESLTDHPERLAPNERVWVDSESEPRRIVDSAWGGRVPVLQLEGVTDRSSAERLAGHYLEGAPTPLPPGSFYWHQLVGLAVTDTDGADLGRVVEVFRAGESEVYRIEGPRGELLVPAIHDVVRTIDLAGGRMVISYEAEEV
jgi:16S rRNA processing protein RimM